MKYLFIPFYLILILNSCLFCSCEKDEEIPRVKRTLIFYLLPGSLDSQIEKNIKDIVEGYDGGNYEIVIYRDKKGTNNIPYLYQIIKKGNEWQKKIVNSFPEFDENSHKVSSMNKVINYIKQRFPAESYALCIGTHGDGWLPGTTYLTTSRSIGPEGGQYMSSGELAEALPDKMFDFILMDVCNMACAEVAYDLQNKAKWMIASTTKIPGKGFPYKILINKLLSSNNIEDLKEICERYQEVTMSEEYEYYGGAISVIDLKASATLHDELAYTLPQIKSYLNQLDVTTLQTFTSDNNKYAFFDMKDFIDGISSDELRDQLLKAFHDCVIYSFAHPYVYGNIRLLRANGLSFYIPNKYYKAKNKNAHTYYFTTNWASELNWEATGIDS